MVGGIILAGIGVLLLLQNLGLPYFDDIERFWPVILIVVGAVQGTRSMGMGGKIWAGAVFTAGLVFLANNFGLIHGDVWKFFWPGILILIGLGMLARTIDRQSYGGYDPQAKLIGDADQSRPVREQQNYESTERQAHGLNSDAGEAQFQYGRYAAEHETFEQRVDRSRHRRPRFFEHGS